MGVVLNSVLGPWSGDAHFCSMSGAAKQMISECDHTWIVFQLLYTEVCCEMGFHGLHIFSEEHRKMVWERVCECPFFVKTGSAVKFDRWWAFEDK